MRTHYCGHVNKTHIDQTVSVCGWVNTRRDHGGIIECVGRERGTTFRVLLPMLRNAAAPRDFEGDNT